MPKKKKTETTADVEVRGVDLGEVKRLLAFMADHGLEEFEYETKDFHVRLRKASPQGHAFRPSGSADATFSETEEHGSEESSSKASSASGASTGKSAKGAASPDEHIVKSPIVGTFYAAPTPGADPFVKLGAKVDEGTVLGIIEAMKLMNEIESDVAGEVVKVYVENGSPVEYGEPLFGIRTSRKK
jgi:acetyl-CoA carboxylase biotin carboxyl carrier protein